MSDSSVSRRAFVGFLGATALPLSTVSADKIRPVIKVWKDPSCGCCAKWIEHLAQNGFAAVAIESSNMAAVKARFAVPDDLRSCHTAEVEGYVIEGHVPAPAIARLLSQKPKAIGLAVPGMPTGSPGMEGGQPEAYAVVLFGPGQRSTFGRYVGANPA